MFYNLQYDYDRGRYCHVCRYSYRVLSVLPVIWSREWYLNGLTKTLNLEIQIRGTGCGGQGQGTFKDWYIQAMYSVRRQQMTKAFVSSAPLIAEIYMRYVINRIVENMEDIKPVCNEEEQKMDETVIALTRRKDAAI